MTPRGPGRARGTRPHGALLDLDGFLLIVEILVRHHRLAERREQVRVEAELHAGIVEILDRRERDHQPLRHIVEGQLHLKAVLIDEEVPEGVLQHNHHLFRVLIFQAFRKDRPRRTGAEADVKMMVARKATLLHPLQNGSDDAAQGFAGQDVVTDLVLDIMPSSKFTGLGPSFRRRPSRPPVKWRTSVARCPPNRA